VALARRQAARVALCNLSGVATQVALALEALAAEDHHPPARDHFASLAQAKARNLAAFAVAAATQANTNSNTRAASPTGYEGEDAPGFALCSYSTQGP